MGLAGRSNADPEPAGDYRPVAAVADVPPGWVATVRVDGHTLALANADGSFYAFDDTCGHAGGPLGDNRLHDGCLVECPWHAAVFDVTTGEPRCGPARKPQTTHPVTVKDGTVFVALG